MRSNLDPTRQVALERIREFFPFRSRLITYNLELDETIPVCPKLHVGEEQGLWVRATPVRDSDARPNHDTHVREPAGVRPQVQVSLVSDDKLKVSIECGYWY